MGFRRVCVRGGRRVHPFLTFLQELWMRVSNIARVVRIPVLAAAVVVPMLVAACSNDPLSPTAQPSRVSAEVTRSDSAGRVSSGGSVPWFDKQTAGTSVPTSASTSGGSVPWF